MSRAKRLQFLYDLGEHVWYSRVGEEVAGPVMDYEGIGADGDYTAPIEYCLDKFPDSILCGGEYEHTRKVPLSVKNWHRVFWGMEFLRYTINDFTSRELTGWATLIAANMYKGLHTIEDIARALGVSERQATSLVRDLAAKGFAVMTTDSPVDDDFCAQILKECYARR